MKFSSPRLILSLVLLLAASLLTAAAMAGGRKASPTAHSRMDAPKKNVAAVPAPAVVLGQPRFSIHMSPPGVGDSAGEPSIGSNWQTERTFSNSMGPIPNGGTALYYGGFLPVMLKVTFSDCSSPADALWEQKPLLSAATPRALGDPILFTDHDTGRTFCGQLEGGSPAGCTIDITDNDGDTFVPSDGVIPSDVDHETIGAGPYHSPLPNPGPLYPHAVYYGSQSVAEARTLRSDNGGLTFNQAGTPMYGVNDCSGLHGHVKVGPDGTVYVPNRGCGGSIPFHDVGAKQTLLVSETNGLTWLQRPVPDSTSHGNGDVNNAFPASHDPSVGVASDGTLYFGYQGADGHPRIAVSHDKGATWMPSFDVGAAVVNGGPILNTAFPAVVAGDPNRASFAFYGTETGGTNWACGNGDDCTDTLGGNPKPHFTGVWYLYVATTFDGGQTWTTQNITPGDPIQRGGICGGGTCRNLLDFFDATIDKEGRVVIGYDDGCVTTSCINGGNNDFASKAAIARQSGGPRMFAQFDPVEPSLPGAPAVTAAFNAAKTSATLTWPIPDNGASPISGYKVYRKTGAATFALIATVPTNNYTDNGLDPNTTYLYRVTAVNGIGEGPYCHDIQPTVIAIPNPCAIPGVLAVSDLNPDGSDNDSGQNTPPDPRVNIRQLFVAEPFLGAGVNKLIFTLQVAPSTAGSPPPSSQWYIVWNRLHPDADFDRYYVAMKTDASGNETFEYGKFGVALDATNPNPNNNTPVKLGDADSGSYNVATGVITITLSTSKAESIQPSQSLTGLNVRTYLARPDAGPKTQSSASDITPDGTYTLAGNASCATTAPFLGVVSRKTHGAAGNFDLPLPLSGNLGIECRSGGPNNNHTLVFTFANPLVSVTGANVSGGTGTISSSAIGSDNHTYVVNLTGVANAQRLTVTLNGVSDTAGNTTSTLSVTLGVLLGDTTNNGAVNSSDISQTQGQSGQVLSNSNFRTDVTVNGAINSSDIATVQSASGTALP